MPNWLGYPTAEEIAAKQAAEAAKFEADIKNGTIGRIVNDREEQKRVPEFRRRQAEIAKAQQIEKAELIARREAAKEFQRAQTVAADNAPVAAAKNPPATLGDLNREAVLAVRNEMNKAPKNFIGSKVGLMWSSKQTQENVESLLDSPKFK